VRPARAPLAAALLLVAAPAWSQGAPTRYVAFGDSITSGVGDDPGNPNPGYPPRLEQLLRDAGRESAVLNRGVGGERTPEGLARIDQVLAAEGGDVLLLMEGSNDISREIGVETTLFNLAEMARRAQQAGYSVVHATTIPRHPRARVDPENLLNQQLNERLRDLAGNRGRQVADHFQVFGTTTDVFNRFYLDDPTDFVGHPTAAGYDIMARTFLEVLTDVDRVPPVTGILSPRNGDRQIAPGSSIRVDVWDFGRGLDTASLQLSINGAPVSSTLTGDTRHVTLTHFPLAPLAGVVRVGLQGRDLASPPNTTNREVASFTIAGAQFLPGDLDRDGRVDGVDLVDFGRRFGARRGDTRYVSLADLNGDQVIDGADLAVLASNFGRASF
jgi:lysophospholipase L1-like esterase